MDVQARADAVEQALAQSVGMFRSPRMFEVDDTDVTRGSVHWHPQ